MIKMLMHVCHSFRHFTQSFVYTVNICTVGKDVSDKQAMVYVRQIKLLLNGDVHSHSQEGGLPDHSLLASQVRILFPLLRM